MASKFALGNMIFTIIVIIVLVGIYGVKEATKIILPPLFLIICIGELIAIAISFKKKKQ